MLHLTKNMRLLSPTITPETQSELTRFSKWILDIGEGNIETPTKEGETETTWIITQYGLTYDKGDAIMLLGKLNESEAHCDRTSLMICALWEMIRESQSITGIHTRKAILIPRICLTLKKNKWPFTLERCQDPIKV